MHELPIDHKLEALAAAKRLRPLAHLKAVIDETPPSTATLSWLKAGEAVPHEPAILELNADAVGALEIAAHFKSPGLCFTQGASLEALQESALLETCAEQGIPTFIADQYVDEYQVYVARAARATGMVISMLPIDLALAQYFVEIGRDLGLEACLQCDDVAQLTTALKTDAPIVLLNPKSQQSHANMLLVARESDDILPRVWLERRPITTEWRGDPLNLHIYSRCSL